MEREPSHIMPHSSHVRNTVRYFEVLFGIWETLPEPFSTSLPTGTGRAVWSGAILRRGMIIFSGFGKKLNYIQVSCLHGFIWAVKTWEFGRVYALIICPMLNWLLKYNLRAFLGRYPDAILLSASSCRILGALGGSPRGTINIEGKSFIHDRRRREKYWISS